MFLSKMLLQENQTSAVIFLYMILHVLFVLWLTFFLEAKQLTPFDLDKALESFNNLNTDYEQTLNILWEAHSEYVHHPLAIELQKFDKFYEFNYIDESNLLYSYNNSFDNVPLAKLADTFEQLPFLNHSIENLKKYKKNTVYILIRNFELDDICKTILNYIDRVKYPFYDFVFLNDKAFDPYFIKKTSHYILSRLNPTSDKLAKQLVTINYGLINNDVWDPLNRIDDYISSLNLTELEHSWKLQEDQNVLYGGSRSYRNMCRFQSMNFYKHPIFRKYTHTMRMEPGVEYSCDFDPFLELKEDTKYAFSIALLEYENTIPTLFNTYKAYPKLKYDNAELFRFIQGEDGGYNRCHFWTNFEIISLEWVKSDEYNTFMDYIDKSGGFYLERWGDAPLRTLAVVETLDINAVQWFDIGYYHNPFSSCPGSSEARMLRKCTCDVYDYDKYNDPERSMDDVDAHDYRVEVGLQEFSCLNQWFRYGGGKEFSFKDDYNLFI